MKKRLSLLVFLALIIGGFNLTFSTAYGATVSVTLTADNSTLNYDDSTIIRWYSTNATYCNGSEGDNGWTGNKGTRGNFYTDNLTNTTTYTITCFGDFGSGNQVTTSVTIHVDRDNGSGDEPTITTDSATNIDDNEATLNGFVDANGSRNVRAWFEWGTNRNYGETTTRTNYGSTRGTDFSYRIIGLDNDETYYFRAVAENDNGDKFYGSQKTFTTEYNENNGNSNPDVVTYSATSIDKDSATLNGYVDANSDRVRKWFEWGTRSNSLSNKTSKSSYSTSSRDFEETIFNLNSNTTYYFRAVAENDNGDTEYGSVLSFRTDNGLNNYENNICDFGNCAPTAITTIASNISQSSVRLNGLGLSNSSVYSTGYFEWGITPGLGIVTPERVIGNGQSNPFYDSLAGLAPGNLYYYRSVVVNEYGTSRGDVLSFRTLNPVVVNNTPSPTVNKNTTVVTNNSNENKLSDTGLRMSLVSLDVNHDNELIKKGDLVEYVISYKNTSSRNLKDVILQVSTPKELEFMEASRGSFSTENGTVISNIGDLLKQDKGEMRVLTKVKVGTSVKKIIVVTANMAYTAIDNNAQEEVFAYAKNTIEEASLGDRNIPLGALAFLTGEGFLPSNLLGWLLIILLAILIILSIRKASRKPNDTPPATDHEHH